MATPPLTSSKAIHISILLFSPEGTKVTEFFEPLSRKNTIRFLLSALTSNAISPLSHKFNVSCDGHIHRLTSLDPAICSKHRDQQKVRHHTQDTQNPFFYLLTSHSLQIQIFYFSPPLRSLSLLIKVSLSISSVILFCSAVNLFPSIFTLVNPFDSSNFFDSSISDCSVLLNSHSW